MEVSVLFFGQVRERVGVDNLSLQNIRDLNELKRILHDRYPGLRDLRFLYSLNRAVESGNKDLKNGDEIALLPPFAGG